MAKLPSTFEELEKFLGRLSEETPRGCGVLGAALLDALIEDVFRSRLARLHDQLLGGVLGSFGARIQIAYALNWINDHTYHDLNQIRSIRNKFAHRFDHELDFDDPAIADLCGKLHTSNKFLNGFVAFGRNNPNLSAIAVEGMRSKFEAPRWRFQIAVETIAQLLQTLPTTVCPEYAGPDPVKDVFNNIASLRFEMKVHGQTPPEKN